MSISPAEGERAAVRGYQWQYDHAAARVYDALVDESLIEARFVDPNAGQVDDVVLNCGGVVHGYQFRSSNPPTTYTFSGFVGSDGRSSAQTADSLVRSLADGWTRLHALGADVEVHLVTTDIASPFGGISGVPTTGPRSFAELHSSVLQPMREGALYLNDVDERWQPALIRLRDATGLSEPDFERFLKSLHLEFGTRSALEGPPSPRLTDIRMLSDALYRRVSESSDVVSLDEAGVLSLVDGWPQRVQFRGTHELLVDLVTYEPLSGAIDELQELLDGMQRGYAALVGPPGSGKSTLFSQALTGCADRVVRYYAYVPQTPLLRTAMTAEAFLHDLVMMLQRSGLGTEPFLPSHDMDVLRESLTACIDDAGSDYATNGRRTIIVVDGLDHVVREIGEGQGLLAELPDPLGLPDGVLLVIGSRTLEPLRPAARTQISQDGSCVDLRNHRLPRASIRDICARAPQTRSLPVEIYEQIAERSDGHPLALQYVLNSLRGATAETASEILEAMPPYRGDMAAIYSAAWETVREDDEILDFMAVCSRLRIGFRFEWLHSWTSSRTRRIFREKLSHLFRPRPDGWRFFHDSFRQFAAHHTALGDEGTSDEHEDRLRHARAANVCAASDDVLVSAEQLYHRICCGSIDEALRLADPAAFRSQHIAFRAPALIRSDIEAALTNAAQRADVTKMLSLVVALAETRSRAQALESVDVAGVLFDVGSVDRAVAFCGDATETPLVYAYRLVERLADAGHPAGQQIFDLVDTAGLRDEPTTVVGLHEHETAEAWARAAVRCRPLETVVAASNRAVDRPLPDGDAEDSSEALYKRWLRHRDVMLVVTDTAMSNGDAEMIEAISEQTHAQAFEILERADSEQDRPSEESRLALLADVVVRAQTALVHLADDDRRQQLLNELSVLIDDTTLHVATLLDAAELFAANHMDDRATHLLRTAEGAEPADQLKYGYLADRGAVDREFRVQRLRFRLLPYTEQEDHGDEPSGSLRDKDTPARPDQADARQLEAAIDDAMRTLARIHTAAVSGEPLPSREVRDELLHITHRLRRPSQRPSATMTGLLQERLTVIRIAIDVAALCGEEILQRFSEMLADRFEQEPNEWPVTMRAEIARQLSSAGADVPWHQRVLEELTAAATTQDITGRLEMTASAARGWLHASDEQRAQELASSLVYSAFGVGYRKDYPFAHWVPWLASAIRSGDKSLIGDAEWLARLIRAVAPTTERSHPPGAADLPAVLASVDPMCAVRLFEYLVRHGVVSHAEALAALAAALLSELGPGETSALRLAGEMAAEILGSFATDAYVELARALRRAANETYGSGCAAAFAESLASRFDACAPSSARPKWRRSLGIAPSNGEGPAESSRADGYFMDDLVLTDGRRFTHAEAVVEARTVEDVVALRGEEAPESRFRWGEILAHLALTPQEVVALDPLFDSASKHQAEAAIVLAETAEILDEHATALRIATEVLDNAPGDGWVFWIDGDTRRRAAAVAVRIGTDAERAKACAHLARSVMSNPWTASVMLDDLQDIAAALAPELDSASTWPLIRSYLEAIAEPLNLDDVDAFEDQGCRWWLPDEPAQARQAAEDPTTHDALAELAVGHISHPVLPVRDAAIGVVARALAAGDSHVADALARFAAATSDHDLLECAGRCITAARTLPGYVASETLRPLEQKLADHPSQILRELANRGPTMTLRPLRSAYRLTLPLTSEYPISTSPEFIDLYADDYELLAGHLALDDDNVRGVAEQYASGAISTLPRDDAIRSAVTSAGFRYVRSTSMIAATREAFGRVLGDLSDADLLDDIPHGLRRRIRTVDIDALLRRPQCRPTAVPHLGEDKDLHSADHWAAGIEERIDEYLASIRNSEPLLVAATGNLLLGRPVDLHEEIVIGATVGAAKPQTLLVRRGWLTLNDLSSPIEARTPDSGEPIVIHSQTWSSDQISSECLAFRPDIAAALNWASDPARPGHWYTAHGQLAATSIWWTDGWWARLNTHAGDTAASGHAVLVTAAAIADITDLIGELSIHIELTRRNGPLHEALSLAKATRRFVPNSTNRPD